jgi:hypothetical protein
VSADVPFIQRFFRWFAGGGPGLDGGPTLDSGLPPATCQ